MIASACLFVLIGVAAATDIVRHMIYNWTTYTGLGIALALNAAASALEYQGTMSSEGLASYVGAIGFQESLAGLATCGGLMLVCYVLFGVGGGDVKLLAMMGAFLGVERGLESLLWTFVLAGSFGIIALAWKIGPATLTARSMRRVASVVRLGSWLELSSEERALLNFPWFLAPTALVAAALVQFNVFH